MTRMSRSLLVLSASLVIFVGLTAAAFAQGSHDITQFGHDITIGPNENVLQATCFGCSIRVRGHVKTDVTVFGGSVIVEEQGQIGTDATVFGGDVRLDSNVKVGGDVTIFGGAVQRDTTAIVGGDVVDFKGNIWLFVIFGLPFVVLGGFIALIVLLVRRLTRPPVPATAYISSR
jgi:hypothetical protein